MHGAQGALFLHAGPALACLHDAHAMVHMHGSYGSHGSTWTPCEAVVRVAHDMDTTDTWAVS